VGSLEEFGLGDGVGKQQFARAQSHPQAAVLAVRSTCPPVIALCDKPIAMQNRMLNNAFTLLPPAALKSSASEICCNHIKSYASQ